MKRIALTVLALILAALPADAQLPMPSISGAVTAVLAVQSGTTGIVTATIPGAAGKTSFLCMFDVSGAGSGSISPVTVTGLVGGTLTYQGILAGAAVPFQHAFWPCIPASAINSAISVSTAADATATAVNVQAWGFQQ